MNPKSQLVLKAAIKHSILFLIIWLGIMFEAWLETDGEPNLKGSLVTFFLLQVVGLILTFRYKLKLDRNPIN